MSDIVWEPPEELVAEANVTRFMNQHGISSYDELIRRSTDDVAWYWDAVVDDLDIQFYREYTEVYDDSDGAPWTDWFVDGTLNIVHNTLDRHATGEQAKKTCLVYEAEDGSTEEWTYEELHVLVNRTANALRNRDICRGDRVALYMPMVPEVVAQLLAIMKIGAIAVPIFSGFAPKAVKDRLQDATPDLVFCGNQGVRRGEAYPIKTHLDSALSSLDTVADVVVFQYDSSADVPMTEERDLYWSDFLAGSSPSCPTEEMDAMDPAMILYTSGTTGKPKGTVHSHGGTLVKVASELAYSFDVKSDDRFWWYSDIGWMMGPWMIIGVHHAGATPFIYDGAPDYPSPGRIWEMIDRHNVNTFGISPTAIRMLMEYGTEPVHEHDLSSLRMLGSTGEPWDETSWRWFFEEVGGEECPIINISGGTDIMGCFLAPLPIHPLKPCTLQGPSPGMDVDVFNEDGSSVRQEVGYLVCKKPAPSMTRSLWKDDDGYIDEYWSRWEHVWNHGDWAEVDEDGFWYLYGRADDTMNVAGRRVGPAEVEGALMEHDAVRECAAVGIPHDVKGEAIAVFVVLEANSSPDPQLEEDLVNLVSERVGPVDRPEVVEFVPDLPKTRSAKIMRRVIRDHYTGASDLGDLSSCENPSCIDDLPVQSS
jgi:acetyl-CoA synthetase